MRNVGKIMGLGRFLLISLIGWALTLGSASGRAEAASPIPVIDLVPTSHPHEGAQTALSTPLGRPVQLTPPDALLTSALRWAYPTPADARCTALIPPLAEQLTQAKRAPTSATPDAVFSGLLELARQQFLRVEPQGALTTLKDAQSTLPCIPQIVPQAQLRTLFLLEAAAHVYAKDGLHQRAFLHMLAVDPRIYLEPDYSPSVQKAFLEAAALLPQQKRIRVDPQGAEGAVFVDGQPLEASRTVPEGIHLIQQRGPLLEVKSALLLPQPTVQATDPVRPAMLEALQPAAPALALEALTKSLQAGTLEPWQKQALDRFLARQGQTQLWMAVKTSSAPGVEVKIFRAGKGLIPSNAALAERDASTVSQAVTPPTASRPPPSAPKKPAVPGRPLATVGIAVQTLRSAGALDVATGMSAGVAIGFELPLGPVRLGVRGAVYALPFRSAARGDDCGQDVQNGEAATEAQLSAAASCLPSHPSLGLGVGAGIPLPLLPQLELTPSLSLEGLYVPEALLFVSEGEAMVDQVAGVGALMPVVQARLAYAVPGAESRVKAWLEPSAGVFMATAAETSGPVLVLGGAGGVGLVF